MSQENVDLVRRAYERLAEQDALGDWSWFFEEFADEDLVLHPQGTYLDAEDSYRGRGGWSRFWREFAEVWEWWRFEPGEFQFLDAGDRVVVLARAVGVGKGSRLEITQDEAHVWTIRDGRMHVATSYVDRGEALEAAGLSE
jgi:ketosteroid isomerase-like protein